MVQLIFGWYMNTQGGGNDRKYIVRLTSVRLKNIAQFIEETHMQTSTGKRLECKERDS